jgi:threonyl-tRNA synthetase
MIAGAMTQQADSKLHAMRHSLAHILASAVKELWPEAKFGVGPVVEHGFYYDIDLSGTAITESDLSKIEAGMREIIKQKQPFKRFELPMGEAIAWAEEGKQPYKAELLNDLKRSGTTAVKEIDSEELGLPPAVSSKVSKVSFYQNGDFVDLCRGPHVKDTGAVGHFKLLRISGAYWRGKETNPQMQRVYGVAFATAKELDSHLEMLAEAKRRDHRLLGRQLDLFVFSDLVGTGLPLFTPRGTVMRQELINFSEGLQRERGYQPVWTPHMARTELYKASGHYDKFPERFSVTSAESEDELMLKPMNCPHVAQIYASQPRSYRDLPLRYMETTTVYRDEKSGELHGLARVRSLTQDDSHAFCLPEQAETEIASIIEMVQIVYEALGFGLSFRLSMRDESDAYLGEPETWQKAEATIRRLAKASGVKHWEAIGEAAFYGPKIDIMIEDSLGRSWQCATVQLDFVQPERFGLEYAADDGSKQRPVMIHKAVVGSIERFLSVYIEHTAGRFPVWLAPEQIRLATLNQEKPVVDFAEKVAAAAREAGLRVTVDSSNQSVSKKVRAAELLKIPYTLVVGEREADSGKVVPRVRQDLESAGRHEGIAFAQFIQSVANEAASRANKASL